MDEDELVVLKRFDNEQEAEFIRSYLESNGIEASTVNTFQPISIFSSGFNAIGNAGILVRRGDLRKAREVIGDDQGMEQDGLEDGAMEDQNSLNGIKGWLGFFCLFLIVINPFFNFMIALRVWREFRPYLVNLPGLHFPIILEMILRVFFIGFSITAGVMLWHKLKGAVRTVKIFLIGLLFFVILLPILHDFLSSKWGVVLDSHEKGTWMSLYPALVYCLGWYTYRWKSKRVSATYGSG